MFYKTANVQITSIDSFLKAAQIASSVIEQRRRAPGVNLITPELFEAVGTYYALSSNPRDYLYITARGVTSDVPNNNGDAFPREELWRFSPVKNCFVYQTFINDPLHVNHEASDPKLARGFLLDAHYNSKNPKDEFVELVIAVDTTKDPALAKNIREGKARTFSMGCTAQRTQCSICNKVAYSPSELCDHLKYYRMQHIAGKQVYEKCYGVDFRELSYVTDPADEKACLTSTLYIPPKVAANSKKTPLIEKLGLSADDVNEVVKFFQYKADELPRGLIVLANILFEC